MPDTALLAAVAGTYRLSSSMTLTIVRDAARLLVTFSGQEPIAFGSVAPTTFACGVADTLLRFDAPTDRR